MAGAVELFFYYYDSRHREVLFRVPLEPSMAQLDEARKVVSAPTFDRDLGWDKDPIGRNLVKDKVYLAQSYGDSFTYGSEVEEPGTWQHQFEELTGKAILNMGVGGYGLDQSVLKFEKYGSQYKTPVAILGLNANLYQRLVSYYSFYFFQYREFLYAFKPLFIPGEQGYELVKPPCATAECLIDVIRDRPERMEPFLREHDYWYRDYQSRPSFGFPYSVNFLKAFPRWLKLRNQTSRQVNYFFVNDHAVELTKHLVDRFVADCQERGIKPLCLIIVRRKDLGHGPLAGGRWDDALLAHLKAKSIPFLDMLPYLEDKHLSEAELDALQAPGGHYTPPGNKCIAELLAQYFAKNKP
jgi:hypothetical protein